MPSASWRWSIALLGLLAPLRRSRTAEIRPLEQYSCAQPTGGGLRVAWLTWHHSTGTPNRSQYIRGDLLARAAGSLCSRVRAAATVAFVEERPGAKALQPHVGFAELRRFAASHGGLDACVEVKVFFAERHELCRALGAQIFIDVIDNKPFLQWATSRKAADADDARLLALRKRDVTLVVQTEHLATHLRRLRLNAVVIPHHHTNALGWGIRPLQRRGPNEPLRVVFLASRDTVGTVGAEISPAVCAGGATLLVVVQKGASHQTLQSSRETCHCNGTQTKLKVDTPSAMNKLDDPHQQNLFFIDEASKDADLAVVWPTHAGWFLERPPTRMLYWWSRGIPTIHSQMYSYIEIAEKEHYGAGAGLSLEAKDVHDLSRVLREVRPEGVRKILREEVLRAAEHYNTSSIAQMFVDEIRTTVLRNGNGGT